MNKNTNFLNRNELARQFLFFSLVLLSLTPFLPIFLGKGMAHPERALFFTVFGWLLLWGIFKSPKWFLWLLLPAFLCLPIEVYLQIYYSQGISSHHLGIITETSPKEASEFLGNKIYALVFIYLLILAWWAALLRLSYKTNAFYWEGKTRWISLVLYVVAISLWFYGNQLGLESASASVSTSVSTSTSSAQSSDKNESTSSQPRTKWTDIFSVRNQKDWEAFIAKQKPLPKKMEFFYDRKIINATYPLGIFNKFYDYAQERIFLTELSEKNKNFQFQAKQNEIGRRAIILVLGESARFDRWSLNGYARDTNPLLSQQSHLVNLSDMITPISATRLSLPVILTRKPAIQSTKAGFTEKSLISAYKEAGFKTYWLSNQMSFGEFDTPTSVIAKEADVTEFLNLGGYTNESSLDEVLLPSLNKALNDPSEKKLIVLHTLGNHWNYSHRHPEKFDQWKPSLFGVINPAYTDLKNKEALSNSYDNSILYTDWFLNEVIERLKKVNEVTALFYTSDHGQTLYDGSCRYAFHGHNHDYEFRIPAFFWYSSQYEKQYPHKVEQIKLHKNEKLFTENIFHTMLDLVNVRYPSEELSASIASPLWQYRTRYVDSYGWAHYDDSHLKGDCREVIDNKMPLERD